MTGLKKGSNLITLIHALCEYYVDMKNLELLGFSASKTIYNSENACMSIDVDTGYVYLVSSTHFIAFAPSTQTVSAENFYY